MTAITDRDPKAREAGDGAGLVGIALTLASDASRLNMECPGCFRSLHGWMKPEQVDSIVELLTDYLGEKPPQCEECKDTGRVEHPGTLEQVNCRACRGGN